MVVGMAAVVGMADRVRDTVGVEAVLVEVVIVGEAMARAVAGVLGLATGVVLGLGVAIGMVEENPEATLEGTVVTVLDPVEVTMVVLVLEPVLVLVVAMVASLATEGMFLEMVS